RHTYPSNTNATVEVFVGDVQCDLLNISDWGVAFRSEKKLGENVSQVRLVFFKQKTLQLDGKILWQRQEENLHLYGFKFISGFLPEGFLQAFDYVQTLKEDLDSRQAGHVSISKEFRLLTYEVHHFLKMTKTAMDRLEDELTV